MIAMLRLAVVLIAGLAVYLSWGSIPLVVTSIIGGIVLFGVLLSVHSNVVRKRNYAQALGNVYQIELAALDGDFQYIRSGKKYTDADHHFNQDIDLFGPGSIFQRINRAQTDHGEALLASRLNSNDIQNVEAKQEAIQELTTDPEWTHHFRASGSQIGDTIDIKDISRWFKKHERIIPSYFSWLPYVFSVLSLAIIIAYSVSLITWQQLLIWFFLGLGITGVYVKRITKFFNVVGKIKETFSQYARLLYMIEQREFQSELLKQNKTQIEKDGEKASVILQQLARAINNLENRNNMLMAPVLNGFMLWDAFYTLKIERWIASFDQTIEHWFDSIHFIDANIGLANYAYNNPKNVYPTVASDVVLEAESLNHPLINPESSVSNSVRIADQDFLIITGANMAGKSTFLRTVALSIVMANNGLPISAQSFRYRPIKLISSMRTSDSLIDDESYFFSELKRLKFIVGEIEEDDYFIILDEILKGTNSKDKAEGSAKFVQRLVNSKSTGLIATHDLSLCVLADQHKSIRNHYFDAEIIDNELHFDYTFKDGICQNMNASFLLKKMGIVE